MKVRCYIIMLAGLLLLTIGYTQVLHKIVFSEIRTYAIVADECEDVTEKTTEENSRETDQDEDFLKHSISIRFASAYPSIDVSNSSYFFPVQVFYPEIVSPPPQG